MGTADNHVSEMLRRGASLHEIEQFIERQPIPDEDRAALWLESWARDAGGIDRRREDPRARVPIGID